MADSAAPSAVQKAQAGPDPLIGRLINDRFKVVALIARGGMGKVYRAEQAPLGRVCALKVLNPNYAGENDPEFHKRFFLEASIASKLTHPNTVTIFDYGRTDDDVYYIAMEYLEGRTLHRAIKEEGPFGEERAAHIARQICRALREAHSLGVIHRDLKPANVYLVEHADEADFVKVLDFGLVKNVEGNAEELTQAGLFMGSPKYMSPEQIRGDRVDARTDIYSLGILLYEMVTGKVPFDRANSVNILMAHVNEPPPPLKEMNPACEVSGALEEVIFKAIAKDPNQRFSSMDEVLAALKRSGNGALTGTMMGAAATGEYSALLQSGSGPHSGSGSGPQQPMFLSPSSGSQSGPVPAMAPGGAAGEPEKKSGKGLVLGIGAVAAVVAVGAFLATRGAPQPATPPPPATTTVSATSTQAPTTTTTATQTATEAAAKPPEARVLVDTEPSGGSVRLKEKDGEELCKDTPCDILLKGDDAKPGTEIKIYVTKKGYSTESKTIKVGSDSKVMVKLTSTKGGGGAPPPVVRPPQPGGGDGFKPVPY